MPISTQDRPTLGCIQPELRRRRAQALILAMGLAFWGAPARAQAQSGPVPADPAATKPASASASASAPSTPSQGVPPVPAGSTTTSEFTSLLDQQVDTLIRSMDADQSQNVRRAQAGSAMAALRGGCEGAIFMPHDVAGRRFFGAALLTAEGTGPAIDGFEGDAVDSPTWSPSGGFLAFTTRRLSLEEPGGDLWIISWGQRLAKRIDQRVVHFSLAPDGLRWLYERLTSDELDGPREVVFADFRSPQPVVRAVESVAFPGVQVKAMGPWGPGDEVEYTLEDLRSGLDRPLLIPRHLGKDGVKAPPGPR